MYISLHNRSCYSFGSALSRPEDLVAFARYHGMPAVALTDLDGMYAVIPFYQACRKAGIKPIIGAELSLEDGVNITLLARSMRGYANLCRLVSLKQLRASSYPTLSRGHERMGHPNANLSSTLSRVHERMGHPALPFSPCSPCLRGESKDFCQLFSFSCIPCISWFSIFFLINHERHETHERRNRRASLAYSS